MAMQKEMKPVLKNAVRSVGKVLELGNGSFVDMLGDELFKEIVKMEAISDLDLRSSKNFSMLLYATGKLLENIGVKDQYFPELKSWVAEILVPHQKELLTPNSINEAGLVKETENPSTAAQNEMDQVIYKMIEAATISPKEVETFFNPQFTARKCGCGDVLGFNVGDSLKYVHLPKEETALRCYIKNSKIGCNGKKINVLSGQRLGSHIKRNFIKKEILHQMDNSFYKASRTIDGKLLPHEEHSSILPPNNPGTSNDNMTGSLPANSETTEPKNPKEKQAKTTSRIIDGNLLSHDEQSSTLPPNNPGTSNDNMTGTLPANPPAEAEQKNTKEKQAKTKKGGKNNKREPIDPLKDDLEQYYKPRDKKRKIVEKRN